MRMLRDPYRRNMIRFRKERALRYAAAQKRHRSAQQTFERNQRNRPANVTLLLAIPFSDKTVAAAPAAAAARRWLMKASAQELTARALKPLGPDSSIWHDLEVGPKKTRIDHLVVGPQGVILIDSMTPPGSVSVEFGTLIHCGQAVPEVLDSTRPRLLAVATAPGLGKFRRASWYTRRVPGRPSAAAAEGRPGAHLCDQRLPFGGCLIRRAAGHRRGHVAVH